MQDTGKLWNDREVIFSSVCGGVVQLVRTPPVTQEVAGSSPVAPAKHFTHNVMTFAGRNKPKRANHYQERRRFLSEARAAPPLMFAIAALDSID